MASPFAIAVNAIKEKWGITMGQAEDAENMTEAIWKVRDELEGIRKVLIQIKQRLGK